ncbi:MAG TPA: TauD/TfdA family dioxygenase, partial [Minicystis sp.]|nr:TauD/TfdA family dioxygenase [Minicystis sp.]
RPFRELLARVKQTSLDAFAHQALPFDKLVQELAPDRDPAWPPIVQALFVLQNASVPRLEAADVTISPHPIPVETTKYDLRVSVTETAERMPFVFEYCADLFEPATIEAFAAAFFALLDRIVASPTALVSELGEAVAPRAASAPAKRKFTAVAPRPVDVRGAELVREARLVGDGDDDVLVVSPAQKYVDLAGWIATNRADVTARLDRHGAILFRGFELGSLERFAAVTRAVCPDLLKYSYRSTPRTELLEGVYSSTEYPADQHIPLHNESAYALSWPLKIFFYCLVPPGGGGQTPIAFSTRVYERISPAVRARFERDGVMYVRNYGAGLDLAWQEVFQTNDPREVEAYCDAQRISVEWLPEGRLRTRQVCQGVARHPVSGAPLWFNQAHLFHVSSLPEPVRGALLERFRQEELPRNTFYGDGSPIEAAALDEVREAYRASEIVFDWRADDVLLLDNMRVAHGRRPFTGPRRIAAAMAEPFSIASQVT